MMSQENPLNENVIPHGGEITELRTRREEAIRENVHLAYEIETMIYMSDPTPRLLDHLEKLETRHLNNLREIDYCNFWLEKAGAL